MRKLNERFAWEPFHTADSNDAIHLWTADRLLYYANIIRVRRTRRGDRRTYLTRSLMGVTNSHVYIREMSPGLGPCRQRFPIVTEFRWDGCSNMQTLVKRLLLLHNFARNKTAVLRILSFCVYVCVLRRQTTMLVICSQCFWKGCICFISVYFHFFFSTQV